MKHTLRVLATIQNLRPRIPVAVLAAIAFCGWCLAHPATATVVNVDFNASGSQPYPAAGPYSGLGAAPDIGTFWNSLTIGPVSASNPTFTSGTLTASDGSTPTGVSVTLNTDYGVYDVAGQLLGQVGVAQELLSDFAYDPDGLAGSPVSFSISLPAGATYDLYLYGGGGAYSDSTSFTIGATTYSTSAGAAAFGVFSNATVTATGNYVKFANLTAPGGTITGSFTGSSSRFSGFQLDFTAPVPEPGVVLLWGVGAAVLWRRRSCR